MTPKSCILLLTLVSSIIYGQSSTISNFDIDDFDQKTSIAEWLCDYDAVAWITSDSAMAQNPKDVERLGKEWFCFEQEGIWHAIYGKYENSKFDLVFHFKANGDGQFNKTYETVDTALLHSYSRALQTANQQLTELRDSVHIGFNQYIKQNADNNFSVWILPAFQPNGVAVYGGEFIYTIDPTGKQILKDDSYYKGYFRGIKVGEPSKVWLDYEEMDKPSLGAVFFVWYYKTYFTEIVIANSKSNSTVFQPDGKGWSWMHALKEEPQKRRKTKNKRK